MSEQFPILDRAIRVVVFCGGPALEPDVKQFLIRLEAEPEIELLAIFCQSSGQSIGKVALDLWRRRWWLAVPLFAMQYAGRLIQFLARPRAQLAVNRQLAQLSDRILFIPDIHADSVLEQMRVLAPDLGLIYGSPILKPALFEIPVFGTFGIHHGHVPKYRGKKTTFWALFNNEPAAGVTIQKVNAGLDTGQIVNQGFVVAENRSYGTVWQELIELKIKLYIKSILQAKSGEVQYRLQEGPKGTLYRDPSLRDIWRFLRLRWRSQLLGK